MGARLAVALAAGALILGIGATPGVGAPGPSDRRCLLEWNAPGNAANRARIVSDGPWSSALLLPATSGTTTWRRGATPTTTTVRACALRLENRRRLLIVTGAWMNGRVASWKFRPGMSVARSPGHSNVRVLPDGRVTKAYRR
jgi:hypothetical protein